MNLRRLLTTTVGIGATAHLLAARKARAIQHNPNPVPYEVLCKEPIGEQRFIERPDGTRIRVLTTGTGPTVVFAHGYGFTLLQWNLIWAQLAALGWRCVAFDLRGHGHSTIGSDGMGSAQVAGDYEAVLRELGLSDVVLIGHSTGGFLALKALLDAPGTSERVGALVLLASTAGDILRGSPQNRLQLPMIQFGLIQAVTRSPTYSWLYGASLCGDTPSPASIRVFNQVFGAQNHDSLVPLIRALTEESYYDRVHEITVPTIVICGERDRTTPRWHSEQLGVRIPNAQNVWLPRLGHILNWEAPDAVVGTLQSLRESTLRGSA